MAGKFWKRPLIGDSFMKKSIAGLTVAGVVAMFSLVVDSRESYEKMNSPLPEKLDNYIASAEMPPSVRWADDFVSYDWVGEKWDSKRSRFNESFPTDCIPSTLPGEGVIYTAKGGDTRVDVFAVVTTPGMSHNVFERHFKALKACESTAKLTTLGDPATPAATYAGGVSFIYGDALIFIDVKTKENTSEIRDFYVNKAKGSLTQSGCANIMTTQEDVKRNPFLKNNEFVGLFAPEKVEATVRTDNLPKAVPVEVSKKPTGKLPEGPYPQGFTTQVSDPPIEQPQKVKLSSTKDPTFVSEITQKQEDTVGPGCGWEWSGIKAPEYDSEAIISENNQRYNTKLKELNNNAEAFVQDRLNESRKNLELLAAAGQWNSWVSETQRVYDTWSTLSKERAKIKSDWYSYVDRHKTWAGFDTRKLEAYSVYNQNIQECNAQNQAVQDWENNYGQAYRNEQSRITTPRYKLSTPTPTQSIIPSTGEPSITVTPSPTPTTTQTTTTNSNGEEVSVTVVTESTPTPTTIPNPNYTSEKTVTITPAPTTQTYYPTPTATFPPRPQTCDSVERPAILDMNRPAEPQPPVIPEGVTIPESWPKP